MPGISRPCRMGAGQGLLRRIHLGETDQASLAINRELVLAKNVPPDDGVPRMTVRSQGQSSNWRRDSYIKNGNKERGVKIGVVSLTCCSRTAMGS